MLIRTTKIMVGEHREKFSFYNINIKRFNNTTNYYNTGKLI